MRRFAGQAAELLVNIKFTIKLDDKENKIASFMFKNSHPVYQ